MKYVRLIVMKYVVLIGVLAILMNCDQSPLDAKSEMIYFKDLRTGLCFAQIESVTHRGYLVKAIANVPCTDNVENLIAEVK
jgi:hypothetical protein